MTNSLSLLARAKVNLFLHLVGQRENGYHELQTLVCFADIGDCLTFTPAPAFKVTVSGLFGAELKECPLHKNLVFKAAELFAAAFKKSDISSLPVALHLEKNLPIASGVGGGSADAAATFQGLAQFFRVRLTDLDLTERIVQLGADVPMCLEGKSAIVEGIGEKVTALNTFPTFPILLVNPLQAVLTPAVFKEWHQHNKIFTQKNDYGEKDYPDFTHASELCEWLQLTTANDLMRPAIALCPVIAQILAALEETEGCYLSRMSGSGASCFGVFESVSHAQRARDNLRRFYPDWWIEQGIAG